MTALRSPHTPGPWEVYCDGFSVAAEDGHIVSTYVEGNTDDECSANARLIAAAPELLEALQDAILFVDLVRLRARRLRESEQEIEAQDCLDKARAAIAKAQEAGQ